MTEWNEFVTKLTNAGKKIRLQGAQLEAGTFYEANLKGADLRFVNFSGASLIRSNIEGACLDGAKLNGSIFFESYLQGAVFRYAICNGSTRILDCRINNKTDFRDVGIDNIHFTTGLKQSIEYNCRKLNWGAWYRKQRWYRYLKVLLIWMFWQCSDYGRSTYRILILFFLLSIGFAGLYVHYPDLIQGLDLITVGTDKPPIDLNGWELFWRAIYFSIVTMTTLGFGDINANPENIYGHIVLMIQVILGYVILGALITRLSTLFNADGPYVDFSKPNDDKKLTENFKTKLRGSWGKGSRDVRVKGSDLHS